ncbi:MAG: hypothetical protein WAL29_10470 [Bacteroidales bacterium]
MTFDNSKSIIGLRIKLFGATVIFLGYLLIAYAARLIKFPLLGMEETGWTVIIATVYVIIVFIPMVLNYQYIYYSDDGNNLVFRYFTSGIFGGKKNSIEINKMTFSGFTIEKRLFGLIQSIILYQNLKEGKAQYPPIYISALTRKEKAKVTRSLNSFTPRK